MSQPETKSQAKPAATPIYLVICLYAGEVTAVYRHKKIERAKAVRDELRRRYAETAAVFRLVPLDFNSVRWLKMEQQIIADRDAAKASPKPVVVERRRLRPLAVMTS